MAFENLIDLMMHFNSEEKCIQHLAKIRWPDGAVCQSCGGFDKINYIKSRKVWWCGDCKKQFSVRVGTIFEGTRAPLQKWFAAIWVETSHKKGISSNQLAKDIGVTQKTAWHMLHRIRKVMGGISGNDPMFGVVELDEAYIGGKEENKHANKKLRAGRGAVGKEAVIGMKERGGNVRTLHVQTVNGETVQVLVRQHIMHGSHLMTDEHRVYNVLDSEYRRDAVKHGAGEYVNGQAHTNSIESIWAVFKRGLYGVYHHASKKHLHRYLSEFDCRHNTRDLTERERFDAWLENMTGHHLTYKELTA